MKVIGGVVTTGSDEAKATDSTQLALTLIHQLKWAVISLDKQIQKTGGLSDALSLALLNASVEAISQKEGWPTAKPTCNLCERDREKDVLELQEAIEKIVSDISNTKRKLGHLEGSLFYMVRAVRNLQAPAQGTEIRAEAQ